MRETDKKIYYVETLGYKCDVPSNSVATDDKEVAKEMICKEVGEEVTRLLLDDNSINSIDGSYDCFQITYNDIRYSTIRIKEIECISKKKKDFNDKIFGLFDAQVIEIDSLVSVFRNWDEANEWLSKRNYNIDENYDEEEGCEFWNCINPNSDERYVLKEIEFEKVE